MCMSTKSLQPYSSRWCAGDVCVKQWRKGVATGLVWNWNRNTQCISKQNNTVLSSSLFSSHMTWGRKKKQLGKLWSHSSREIALSLSLSPPNEIKMVANQNMECAGEVVACNAEKTIWILSSCNSTTAVVFFFFFVLFSWWGHILFGGLSLPPSTTVFTLTAGTFKTRTEMVTDHLIENGTLLNMFQTQLAH